jgi:hypothetical protein
MKRSRWTISRPWPWGYGNSWWGLAVCTANVCRDMRQLTTCERHARLEVARNSREEGFTQDLAVSRREIASWRTFAKTRSTGNIAHILSPTTATHIPAPRPRKSAITTDVHTAPPPVHLDNPQRPAGNQNLPTYDAYDGRSRSGPIGRLVEWRYGA